MKIHRSSIFSAIAVVVFLKEVAAIYIWSNPIECPDQNKHIRVDWICDGTNDCSDGSDESYCTDAGSNTCESSLFRCSSGMCLSKSVFCNGVNDCLDNSDEFYCDIPDRQSVKQNLKCPHNWIKCNDGLRCIQENWKCDIIKDCFDGSDEVQCATTTMTPMTTTIATPTAIPMVSLLAKSPQLITAEFEIKVASARSKLIHWFLKQRKNDSSTERWGLHLHRTAIALYLADKNYFAPENKTGEEIGYELTIRLLHKLSGNNTLRTPELALYIQSLMITCADPKNFFGHDLVAELRRRVDSNNYTNPYEILVLCNAGDTITEKDIERVTTAFDSQHRPFWTDTQAISTMALQCMSRHSSVRQDERTIIDMQQELKKRQFKNGTVDNAMTTALVIQALLSNETYKEFFNMKAALESLLNIQQPDGSWGSVRNSYYVLPVLSYKNLVDIDAKHCKKSLENEEETLAKLQEAKGEKITVQYSVWIGNNVDLERTWRVKILANNTFYNLIETVRRLDTRHNVVYNVIEDKPYVTALYGKEEDSELGLYWFTYSRPLSGNRLLRLIETSPVDVKVEKQLEFILWYKPATWNESSVKAEF